MKEMEHIRINENHGSFIYFGLDEGSAAPIEICDECGLYLDRTYAAIINRLRENGLLDKNFPTLCCDCIDD